MPNTSAKFPKGVPMSVEDVAAVVGPEFKEMHENPPPSVVKVREQMERKKASLKPWIGRLMLDREDARVLGDRRYRYVPFSELDRDSQRQAMAMYSNRSGGKYDFAYEHYFYPTLGDGILAKSARRVLAIPRRVIDNPANMASLGYPEPNPGWGDKAASRERLTWTRAAGAASGLYGYPRSVQRLAESSSRKLARTALQVAKRAFKKDENVVPFLQEHAKREGSKSAHVLLAAMKEIGPKLASELRGGTPKEAGAPEYGLYGFKARTADLGLDACKEVRSAAGRITADLHRRKADLHDKITGFWGEHSKQGNCAYAGMLLSCYPNFETKLAATSVVGSVLPGTNRFVHASSGLRQDSGIIREATVLPSDFRRFQATVLEKAAADGVDPSTIRYRLDSLKDVHVSSFANDDGSRDADGLARMTASYGDVPQVQSEVGFTGVYEPALPMTVLASGDWIEWEE